MLLLISHPEGQSIQQQVLVSKEATQQDPQVGGAPLSPLGMKDTEMVFHYLFVFIFFLFSFYFLFIFFLFSFYFLFIFFLFSFFFSFFSFGYLLVF
jgi:hypothetical protein